MKTAENKGFGRAGPQTLGMQVEVMSADINDRGWNVAKSVEEVGSGVKDRPGRELLLKAARRREADVVVAVVWCLDRWGRSLPDLMVTLRELAGLGVGLRLADRGVGPDHADRSCAGKHGGGLRRDRA